MDASSAVQQINQHLTDAQSQQFSGRLILQGQAKHSTPWMIDFKLGMIVWVGQSYHRNRRWLRAIQECCPDFLAQHWPKNLAQLKKDGKLSGDHWEVELLEKSWHTGLITIAHCKAILETYLLESLISLSSCDVIEDQWIKTIHIPKLLVIPSVSSVMEQALTWQQQRSILSQKYSATLLKEVSFDFAPVITKHDTLKAQANALVYKRLSKILTGHNTFWDIAILMQQSWISVACVLLPLIKAQTIEVKEIEDTDFSRIPQPSVTKPTPLTEIKQYKTIVCIDDSPVIAKELERILQPQGYEVLSILDPVKGLATLIKAQPCFIFLDLVMPNTNGYEICSFLRKSPQFKDLPIVMLTGHDGIVDRLRAKMVGSTDFLGKPPDPKKVIQVVQKYLQESQTSDPPMALSDPSYS